ncbi:MAG: HD domain-containing phosphohydrolase, partial [Sulfuricella sp.]
ARAMGLKEEVIEGLYFGAMIHDIGKISVPAEILSKPGALTKTEYQLIQCHPETGFGIVQGIEFPWPVAEMIAQHHERLDGSGYPKGCKGETIIIEARIIAVADVVEAMTTHRPYRPALGLTAALEEISQGKGIRYDPTVVEACIRVIRTNDMQLPQLGS